MRTRNRVTALALVLALMLVMVLPAGCKSDTSDNSAGGNAQEATKDPYVIGAVLSLTGAQAGIGQPEKNAIEMERDAINKAGGINGHPLEVIIEDDASDVDQAIASTTKLIEQDEVLAVIGSSGTGQSMAMRAEIDAAGVPQVALGSGAIITRELDPLVFQTTWTADLIVPLALDYLKSQGYTKIGLITEDTGFGKDGREVVNKLASNYALAVVADQVFKPTDTDATGQLTVIKAASPDVVVMWASVSAASMVPKNMGQLNMDVPLVCGNGVAKQEFIDGAGAAGEGVLAFAGKVLAPEAYGKGSEGFKVATSFVERYKAAYGVAPDHFAGHAYDGIHIVADALGRCDEGFTSADLRDAIEKTSGLQGIGGNFTFSPTDHNGMTKNDIVLYRIKDGKWVLAQ